MKLSLNTSDRTTILELDDKHYEWESGHDLARDLLKYIHDRLEENGADWKDITELHFFTGPGSFTGLRIGACVINALADQLQIPIFDQFDNQHDIVMPEYGREANISKPKK